MRVMSFCGATKPGLWEGECCRESGPAKTHVVGVIRKMGHGREGSVVECHHLPANRLVMERLTRQP